MRLAVLATLLISQTIFAQSLKPLKHRSDWRQDPKNIGCQYDYVKNILKSSIFE